MIWIHHIILTDKPSWVFIMQKNRILLQLSNIEDQLSILSEKLYNPQLTSSEVRELSKKKKKLKKDMSKLKKRLEHSNE